MKFYRVIIGDSREKMKLVKDKSVNLIVTSPPYFQLVEFTKDIPYFVGDLSRISDRKEFFYELSKVWKECARVLVDGGYLVCEFEDIAVGSRIVGFPREICLVGDMVNSIEKSGLYLIARVIWKKFEPSAKMSNYFYLRYSHIKQSSADPRFCLNWAYCFVFKKPTKNPQTVTREFTMEEWDKYVDGVWNIPHTGGGEGLASGAVFPVELVERFIKIYTKKGQTVLDPFGGTGTTMKAAFNLKRNCILIEVNKKMIPIIKEKVGWGTQSIDEEIVWEMIDDG